MRVGSSTNLVQIHYFVFTGGKGTQMITCASRTHNSTSPSSCRPWKNQSSLKCTSQNASASYLHTPTLLRSTNTSPNSTGSQYITNLCPEIPALPQGSFKVQTQFNDLLIKTWCRSYNQPIRWISLPLLHLFECLDIEHIIVGEIGRWVMGQKMEQGSIKHSLNGLPWRVWDTIFTVFVPPPHASIRTAHCVVLPIGL